MAPWAAHLRDEGYAVLRIDQRAHGRSEGAVCAYGQRAVHDVVAGVRFLEDQPAVDASRIAVAGTSMGAGTVLAAAPRLEAAGVRALVLLAPASDYGVLARRRVAFLGPLAEPLLDTARLPARAVGQVPIPSWVPRDEAAGATLPMLVVHSDTDAVIPVDMSLHLVADLDDAELLVLEGGAHEEMPRIAAEQPAVDTFLRTHLD